MPTPSRSAQPPRLTLEAFRAEVRVELARQQTTQNHVADVLNVGPVWLSRRLTGSVPLSLVDADRIAAVLGLTLAELIERAQQQKESAA